MATDAAMQEVEQLLKVATVPVLVTLHSDDLAASAPPPPLYYNVPRASLLAAIWGTVCDSLRPFTADFGEAPRLWLSFAGDNTPLPWNRPIGALVDGRRLLLSGDNIAAPVHLVAHTNRPADGSTSQHWLLTTTKEVILLAKQRMKQTLMAMYGDPKAFYDSPTERLDGEVRYMLATSAAERQAEFAGHCEYTAAVESSAGGRCVRSGRPVRIPLTCQRNGKTTSLAVTLPVVAADDVNTTTTSGGGLSNYVLGSVLAAALPETDVRASNLSACIDATTAQVHFSRTALPHGSMFDSPHIDVAIGGLPVALDTPLDWALRHLTYADGVLHLTVVEKPTADDF